MRENGHGRKCRSASAPSRVSPTGWGVGGGISERVLGGWLGLALLAWQESVVGKPDWIRAVCNSSLDELAQRQVRRRAPLLRSSSQAARGQRPANRSAARTLRYLYLHRLRQDTRLVRCMHTPARACPPCLHAAAWQPQNPVAWLCADTCAPALQGSPRQEGSTKELHFCSVARARLRGRLRYALSGHSSGAPDRCRVSKRQSLRSR